MVNHSQRAHRIIQHDALMGSAANTVINGIISWFMVQGKTTIPLTVDTISAHEKTVFSMGVMSAFILSLILGTIAFFNFGKKAEKLQLVPSELLERPYFFFGLKTVLFYTFFIFGTATLVALFLQKFLGSIEVSILVAAILLGLIAGATSWFINTAVMKAMLRSD